MRVTVEFGDNVPSVQTMLAGAPSSGDVIELNGLYYRVHTVQWNANPAPMRAVDVVVKVNTE